VGRIVSLIDSISSAVVTPSILIARLSGRLDFRRSAGKRSSVRGDSRPAWCWIRGLPGVGSFAEHVGTFLPFRVVKQLQHGQISLEQALRNLVRIGEEGAADWWSARPIIPPGGRAQDGPWPWAGFFWEAKASQAADECPIGVDGQAPAGGHRGDMVQPVRGGGQAVGGMRAARLACARGLVFPVLRKARKGGDSTGFPRVRNSCRSMLTTTTSPRLFMTRPKATSFSGQSPRRTGHGIETWTKVVSGRSASVRNATALLLTSTSLPAPWCAPA
jgi:hypothetical protein